MDTFDKIVCRIAFSLMLFGLFLSIVLTHDGAKAAGWPAQNASSMTSSNFGAADQEFIRKAADDEVVDLELGKLVLRKGSNPEVKKFGQRMIDDHGKTYEQLKAVASRKGMDLPGSAESRVKETIDRLAKLSGSQFDNAYMAEMLKDHKQDIEDFRKIAATSRDNDVKNFAQQILPTIQSHLKQAERIAPELRAQRGSGQKPSPAIAQAHPSNTASRATGKLR
jgi:putative membrane protein